MDTHKFFAFVLMPFDSKFNDLYKFGIKEAAAEIGIHAERVDEQIYSEGILERIYRQIEVADIIIADMTGQNPNVFYEVGYAHAKEKLCILLTANSDDIPFDLKHQRHIVYSDSIQELKHQLTENLEWAKKEIENIEKSHIQVNLKNVFGYLDKSKFSAQGDVHFTIDLSNESNNTSAEIDAIYFYTTKAWNLYQDNKICPSTESDLPIYEIRHFLNSPMRRLHKNSWAQIKFNLKRTLALATKGEELKDSYRVHGTSNLRLSTSEGNFDYELPIDIMVDEIPF